MVERGEGTSQRICMNDPWTSAWGWTGGVWCGLGEEGRKIGTAVVEQQLKKENQLFMYQNTNIYKSRLFYSTSNLHSVFRVFYHTSLQQRCR